MRRCSSIRYDPGAIADGIYRVLTDERLRRELRRKGLARARQFSWETSVRRVREIYGEVGERPAVPRVARDAREAARRALQARRSRSSTTG